MKKKKEKYTPPIAYDLTHAVSDDAVVAANCTSGIGATPNCLVGTSPGSDCSTGNSATPCGIGNSAGGGTDCKAGTAATGKCAKGTGALGL
ncbi:MAG: hypothetical protein HQ594_00565 [Candidatus Omnitrophica bacterium]|nr:hypothetical protein [Candidatus Omnitrophota bacterium]